MVYNDFLEYNLTGVTKNLFTSLYSFHFESKKKETKNYLQDSTWNTSSLQRWVLKIYRKVFSKHKKN